MPQHNILNLVKTFFGGLNNVFDGANVPCQGCQPDSSIKITEILNAAYLFLGILCVIVIIIAGITYMTAEGEPDKLKKAQHTITYAVIGLLVALAAAGITNFVIGAAS